MTTGAARPAVHGEASRAIGVRPNWPSLRGPAAFPGWEDITYTNLGAIFRLAGPHGVSVVAGGSRRTARYPDVPDIKQNATTLFLNYVWLSDKRFGAPRRAPASED